MKIKILIILITVLLFSGCQTANNGLNPLYSSESSKVKMFTVKIISEPLGAKIEINNNYVGETPITVKVEGWQDTQTFIRGHTIVAHPVEAEREVQIKSFMGWHKPDKTYGDKIPNTIYFNMNLVRTHKQLDLYINR